MLPLAMLLPTLSLHQSGLLAACALPSSSYEIKGCNAAESGQPESLLIFKHAVSPASKLSLHDAHSGDWGIGDDRRLLKALFRSGCSTEWQVDWSVVVPQRTAVAAKRRWRLMLKSVPDAQEKEFPAIVDELVSRYVPALKQRAGQAAPGGSQGEGEGGEPARTNAQQGAEQEAAAGPQGNAAEPARAHPQQPEAYEQEEPSEEATSLLDDSMHI